MISVDVGHVLPITGACDDFESATCFFGYDTIGQMMRFLLTNLKKDAEKVWNSKALNWQEAGILRKFSQTAYLDSDIFETTGLADVGYIFYPK